jgi:hypothetical protein
MPEMAERTSLSYVYIEVPAALRARSLDAYISAYASVISPT